MAEQNTEIKAELKRLQMVIRASLTTLNLMETDAGVMQMIVAAIGNVQAAEAIHDGHVRYECECEGEYNDD